MPIPPAQRLRRLPRYVFQELASLRAQAVEQGREVIDLTVGNPDGRAPDVAIAALTGAAADPTSNRHRYAPFDGSEELRRAVADWYQTRFAVPLDAAREVLPLLGSKEGLYHLMQAYVEEQDTVLIPTPCYPAYLGAARLAGAKVWELPLREEDRFLARFEEVPSDVARAAKILLLNYPHNPTGAVCGMDHYRDALAFCRDHDVLLVSDIPYSELSLEDDHLPGSVLELPGAREQAVEFQSLSKSHCMAGWRVGFCVGNAEVISNLVKLKANVDFGLFLAIQEAAVVALANAASITTEVRATYRRRRDRLCQGLSRRGWNVRVPPAGMYVWTRLPEGFGDDDWRFVRELFARTGVLVSPGTSFGSPGRGYVRMSLVVDEAGIDRVLQAIDRSGLLAGRPPLAGG